jgi:hypothetical protein
LRVSSRFKARRRTVTHSCVREKIHDSMDKARSGLKNIFWKMRACQTEVLV